MSYHYTTQKRGLNTIITAGNPPLDDDCPLCRAFRNEESTEEEIQHAFQEAIDSGKGIGGIRNKGESDEEFMNRVVSEN